jgi:hypothetical protein
MSRSSDALKRSGDDLEHPGADLRRGQLQRQRGAVETPADLDHGGRLRARGRQVGPEGVRPLEEQHGRVVGQVRRPAVLAPRSVPGPRGGERAEGVHLLPPRHGAPPGSWRALAGRRRRRAPGPRGAATASRTCSQLSSTTSAHRSSRKVDEGLPGRGARLLVQTESSDHRRRQVVRGPDRREVDEPRAGREPRPATACRRRSRGLLRRGAVAKPPREAVSSSRG